MTTFKKLSVFCIAAAMVTSVSAFGESRHRDATRSDTRQHDRARAESVQRSTSSRSDAARQNATSGQSGRYRQSQRQADNRNQTYDRSQTYNRNQTYDRNQTYNHNQTDNRNQSYDRSGRSRNDRYRNDRSHNDGYRNGARHDAYRYDGRRNYSTHGRVTRLERYRGGYRVWIGGGYPFFVPEAVFRLHPFRIGINIALGGYWNPAGYYDVYDSPYGYNTSGDLRGVVESVDYRRGTLVLRDDISGNFVTTVLRGGDPRLGSLRPGDYVDLGGEWSRSGVFSAYNVLDLQDGRYDGRY